jgi:hypothetical protein
MPGTECNWLVFYKLPEISFKKGVPAGRIPDIC